jgi:hypothetical protein
MIGHTGSGDFGHGVEKIFAGLSGIEVVAVADPNAAGRTQAKTASGAARDCADYREMLERETLNTLRPRAFGGKGADGGEKGKFQQFLTLEIPHNE